MQVLTNDYDVLAAAVATKFLCLNIQIFGNMKQCRVK
jgi:hypothetical protein